MSIVSIARSHIRSACIATFGAALGVAALVAAPVAAQQIESVDPNEAIGPIDGDLVEQPGDGPIYADERVDGAVNTATRTEADAGADAPGPSFGEQMAMGGEDVQVAPEWADPVVTSSNPSEAASQASSNPSVAAAQGNTYKEDDLIGAAEGVFGKGAEGVARMIQDLLKEQGEPSAYIVGREASGAFVVGARYGSGTMYHKVEGEREVYWTGPSIGFDAGANAGNTFVLVYNLYDTEELFKRFPAGEGQAYLVGGMHASYMRRGDTVLIPIRVGAGLRLGVNAGYMRFSKKHRWLPF
ncbi:DUF1134 domain-containing protein [Pontixanthobacter aestiaquae]|uniref:DUF1134 domain-containing protein n=1 Tax=Pontixanthobacter aestiaquae TaxID=1509367 RepID=A0A844Z236_9SPHN|nr:DUF1134 domain-containing protein [Pontixanthobacter aestiaquae]MDN3646247.1 DUF1134 domain-containing protein [Pontixanthobacter aestiaquae]MXO82761.1 DUF1134 domain-containing protein [Pontixanthobacter aestiaquae]